MNDYVPNRFGLALIAFMLALVAILCAHSGRLDGPPHPIVQYRGGTHR